MAERSPRTRRSARNASAIQTCLSASRFARGATSHPPQVQTMDTTQDGLPKVLRDPQTGAEIEIGELETVTDDEIYYVGMRGRSPRVETRVWRLDRSSGRPLPLRLDVANHSPDGFEWGYAGSGPAQLALAICCDIVGEARARLVYQFFKEAVIARIGAPSFRLSQTRCRAVIERLEAGRRE